MRPDIGDILAGVQRIMTQEIVPALPPGYLREKAMYTLFLLEHCRARWHLAPAYLRDENAALHHTLQRLLEVARDDLPAGLAAEIEEFSPADADSPVPALQEENLRLREQMSRVRDAADSAPPRVRERVRKEIAAFARKQLEREREWVKVGEVVW
ncbi:MAG: hypothetical protein HYS09_08970 [Chloroflexi bacterium]|nr:hypothetical protein [Chloroflexota bacterium]